MKIRRVVPNITAKDLEKSKEFYGGLIGLELAMDLPAGRERVVTFVSPDNRTAQVTLVAGDSPLPPPMMTIEVGDVDAVHRRALASGIRITYPLTTELYGIRRFHAIDPNGVVVNVMSHVPSTKPT